MLITRGSPAEAAVETTGVNGVRSQNIIFLILQMLALQRLAQTEATCRSFSVFPNLS